MPRSTTSAPAESRPVSPTIAKRLAAQAARSARRRRIQVIAVSASVLVVGVLAIAIASSPGSTRSALPEVELGSVELVRDDTRFLSRAEVAETTVVEFIDFECSACAVVHPAIAQLRETYGDRVDFALRHLPLPMHDNAIPAALAVEAAAEQGAMIEMIDVIFANQAEWGGAAPGSQGSTFRGYAEQLGLDLAAYDRDIADPATLARISRDAADAAALGARGTPTFFIDGELVMFSSYQEFESRLVAALED